jgi:hypothetical protein
MTRVAEQRGPAHTPDPTSQPAFAVGSRDALMWLVGLRHGLILALHVQGDAPLPPRTGQSNHCQFVTVRRDGRRGVIRTYGPPDSASVPGRSATAARHDET